MHVLCTAQGLQCIQPKPVVFPVPAKTTCLRDQDINPDQLLTQGKPLPEPIPVAEPTKTNEPSKQDKPRRKHDFCRSSCSYNIVTLRTLWFFPLLSRYSFHWNIWYCQVSHLQRVLFIMLSDYEIFSLKSAVCHLETNLKQGWKIYLHLPISVGKFVLYLDSIFWFMGWYNKIQSPLENLFNVNKNKNKFWSWLHPVFRFMSWKCAYLIR